MSDASQSPEFTESGSTPNPMVGPRSAPEAPSSSLPRGRKLPTHSVVETEPAQPNPRIPELPAALRAPGPVIVAGMAAWLVATVVVAVTGVGPDRALTVCWVGLAVGALGTVIVLVQRGAVRRGAKGAQVGLN